MTFTHIESLTNEYKKFTRSSAIKKFPNLVTFSLEQKFRLIFSLVKISYKFQSGYGIDLFVSII